MTFDQAVTRFIEVEQALGIRRTLVLFITLWMTYKSYAWAAEFAYVAMVKADGNLMIASAAQMAAVMAPITYLQKAVFDAYISSRAPSATDTLTTTTTLTGSSSK